jgi:prepilin signal peptidase PulO-like enzyme (type II secretory pathway)
MKGRSKCLSCGEALRPSDLIPVLSYVLLRGKCRYCSSRFGISALFIEIGYGLVFVALYQTILKGQESILHSFGWLVYYSALFIVLGVMALYDKAHTYIPLSFLSAYSLLTLGMFGLQVLTDTSIATITAPFVVSLPFFMIWMITRGRGVGFGDVVLFFGVGAFFGLVEGLAVFVLSVWMGALVGVYFKYFAHDGSYKKQVLAFVPFIVFAFIIVLFTGIDVVSIAMMFA